jgi:uncharacterized protein YjiS (DUF1127 family)
MPDIAARSRSQIVPRERERQGFHRNDRSKCGRAVARRGWLARFLSTIELALEVRRERRMLRGLDERALKDLGLKGKADAEASRPFWDVPSQRLRG